MEWIIKALKKGGKAFVVVPDGILNRQNDKNLRQYILDTCYIDAIISLPVKTFFTTPKKTYILAITKKNDISEVQTDPVFTYLVSEIGESRDIYRFDIEQDDLSESVILFSQFNGLKRGKKSSFRTEDKKCKTQDIKEFNPSENWSIDRWFTREEKIELGIEEENKVMSVNEFSDIANELGITCIEFSASLKDIGLDSSLIQSNFCEIELKNKAFFDLCIGRRIVKKDLINIKDGIIPIYSANVFNPIGFAHLSNIKDFNNDFVLWGIDGDFKFNYIKKGQKFCTTDHCGTIRILDKNILPEYLMIELDKVKHVYGFDRGLRSSLKNMQNIIIRLPVNLEGNIDVVKQQSIIEKYKIIFTLKEKIREYKVQIENKNIKIRIDDFVSKQCALKDLFVIKQGNAIYTKKRILEQKLTGNIPVYSSNTKDDGLLIAIDIKHVLKNDLYYQHCLTWSVDGYAGTLFVRNETNVNNKRKEEYFFTINNHCGILLPKISKMDLEFIKYTIQPYFYEASKGYGNNKVGTNQIENIQIKIPITPSGEFDLQKQKEIADNYRKIEKIKKSIKIELEKIENIKIDIGL